jgi:DNA-binding CsgD family transcriptional regulator
MELRASDLRRILSVLDDLGRVSDLNGFAARGVAGLHRLVPSRAISFHEIDHRNFGVHPKGEEVRFYREQPYHDGRPIVGRLSDAISRRELTGLHFYREMMRPVGREHELKLALPSPNGTCRAFFLTRETCDYSDRELDAMIAIQPHLVHAFDHVHTRELVDRTVRDDQRVGSSGRIAAVSLGPDDRIGATLGPALELLAAYVGLNGGRLPDPLDTWVGEQRRRARSPEIGEPPRSYVVSRGPDRLIARFLADGGTGQIVLEERRSESSGAAPSGLSAREIEVLLFVRDGLTNKEVARRLSIKAGTVRKHLENAYAKLGVGTRTAAVAKAFARPTQ